MMSSSLTFEPEAQPQASVGDIVLNVVVLGIFAAMMGLTAWCVGTERGWFASVQVQETALVMRAGLVSRMAELDIASIEREREVLTVTLKDGTARTLHVCAWNDEAMKRGGCSMWTSGSGRYYKLTGGVAATYRGAPHKATESADDILDWLRTDLKQAEELATTEARERDQKRVAVASWRE